MDLFRVPPRDRDLGRWLNNHFLQKAPGWPLIWRRALAMGASARPYLADAIRGERNQDRRLVLTGAYSLAARRADVVFLGNMNRSPSRYDRFVALFSHALGPRQPSGAAALLGGVAKTASPLEQIAACMAVARCADRGALPARFTDRAAEIGVLAGALYCVPDRRQAWIKQQLKGFRAAGHEHLVWRGYLLGAVGSGVAESDRLRLAVEVIRRQADAPVVGEAAACYLGHAPGAAAELQAVEIDKLSLEQRLLLAHSRTFRGRVLQQRAVPRATEPEVLQRRFVTLQVRWGDLDRIAAALADWQRLPAFAAAEHRRGLGQAVVWRLLTLPVDAARATRLELDWLLDGELRRWVAVARGEDTMAEGWGAPTGAGSRAMWLLARGQLSRTAAAAVLEAEVWRAGSHPGLVAFELHRRFLAELLIDGSRTAATRFVRAPRKPYIAEGIGREEFVFRVAHELWKFMREARPWSLPEYQLAR